MYTCVLWGDQFFYLFVYCEDSDQAQGLTLCQASASLLSDIPSTKTVFLKQGGKIKQKKSKYPKNNDAVSRV